MNNVYGITLKNEGKIYYFNGQEFEFEKNSYVIVETEKGVQLGKVMYKVSNDKLKIPKNALVANNARAIKHTTFQK